VAGDTIEYDLYVSHKIQGIGSFDIDKDHNQWGEVMRDKGTYKFIGVQDGVTGNPHNALVGAAGVWEHRKIASAEEFHAMQAGVIRLMYPVDNAAIPANTTVTVRLANIKITNGPTTKAVFFDANNVKMRATPNCNVDGLPSTPEHADITTTFKTVKPPEAMTGAYIETAFTNTSASAANFTAYLKIFEDTYDFVDGDYIEYDVAVSSKIKGMGAIELELSGGAGGLSMRNDFNIPPSIPDTAFDQNGVHAHPGRFEVDAAGELQHRKINIPLQFIASGPAPVAMFVAIDTATIPAGETVYVWLKNIRITNGGVTKEVFFDATRDLEITDPQVIYGSSANLGIAFKTEGATAKEDEPIVVPPGGQTVNIDGIKDAKYSDMFMSEILDAYANGGLDPVENYDNVTGKVWYIWDDYYIYFYLLVNDDKVKVYNMPDGPLTEAQEHEANMLRIMTDSVELSLDPDPTNNPHPHFDENTRLPGCGEVGFGVSGGNLSVFNYSEKNKRVATPEYLNTFKTNEGYGFEMKWERVPGEKSFRFNAAIHNDTGDADTHYAVALGKAWWSSYEAAIEVYFDDLVENTDKDNDNKGDDTKDGETGNKVEGDNKNNDDKNVVKTGVETSVIIVAAVLMSGVAVIFSRKRRMKRRV